MGIRALFAVGFTNQLLGFNSQVKAFASGFEEGRVSPRIKLLLNEEGIAVPAEPLPTVFERKRNDEVFNYVVTLCHDGPRTQSPAFLDSINAVYARESERVDWKVKDFRSIESEGDRWLEDARKIRSDIRDHVSSFLLNLGL